VVEQVQIMSGETWVAIASLIVTGAISALALWLNFRERRSTYRSTLYSRQVEAYAEIVQAANQVVLDAYNLADQVLHSVPVSGKALAEGDEEVGKSKMHFREVRRKWIIFLPTKVQNALNDFDKSIATMSYWDLTDFDDDSNEPFEVNEQYVDRITTAYIDFVEAAREALGTNPLSAETMALIGKKRRQEKPSVRF
jgi:hypothetical protein